MALTRVWTFGRFYQWAMLPLWAMIMVVLANIIFAATTVMVIV